MYTYFIYITETKSWIEVSEAEYEKYNGKKIKTQ